jgi:hypothetical protein
MDIFLNVIGVLILLFWVFIYNPSRRMMKQENAWFESQNIIEEVYSKAYNDKDLAKNFIGNVVVGIGKKKDNSNVGYVYEIVPGKGIVESIILNPSEIEVIPEHIQNAKNNGMTLIDSLQQFRKKNS